jgi:CheY-like chemotaxis protein
MCAGICDVSHEISQGAFFTFMREKLIFKEKKSILIVDDEPGFHHMFRFLLEPMGIDVSSAYDGLEGLESFKKGHFDLILSDVHMPKMPGPELFDRIREIKPDQLVIVMSSGSDPDYNFEKEAQNKGAVACLYKPFEVNQIIDVIEKALNKGNP